MIGRPAEEPKQVQNTIDAFVDTSHIASRYGIKEKSFLQRLDLKLLPVLSFLYLLSFLDRSNVGNARIEGLTRDLHMTGNEYLTGLTLFFVGYVIFEVPAQMVLKLWTPQMWLPTIVIAWLVLPQTPQPRLSAKERIGASLRRLWVLCRTKAGFLAQDLRLV